jgi:serine protease AprX
MKGKAAAELANDPDVVYISPDRAVKGALDVNRQAVFAGAAGSYGLDGMGVGVAVIDSGVTASDDFLNSKGRTRLVYSKDFTGSVKERVSGIWLLPEEDTYGHGTHVAGIIAGNSNVTRLANYVRHYQGIASGANIINLKALDGSGAGRDSWVISAIQHAIAMKTTYNIRVINLSLGRGVFESYKVDPLCQAVEAAWKAGIVVVASAGNDGRNNVGGIGGYGTVRAPGNDPYVITVGAMKSMGTATRADDAIATYSSKGPTLIDHVVKPDLVAPGNRIIAPASYRETISGILLTTTIVAEYPATQVQCSDYDPAWSQAASYCTSAEYFRLSGTSMAVPW